MAVKLVIDLHEEDELRNSKLSELEIIPEIPEMKKKLMKENSDLLSKFDRSDGVERRTLVKDLKKRMELLV